MPITIQCVCCSCCSLPFVCRNASVGLQFRWSSGGRH